MPGNQLITLETKTFCLSCVNHTNQFGQRKSLAISEFQWINEEGKVELKITLLQVLVIALGNRHQDPSTSQKTDKRTLGASWWKDTCHQGVLSKNPFWIRTGLKVWLLVRKCRAQSRTRNITDLAQSLLWGEPKPRPWRQMLVLTSPQGPHVPRRLVAAAFAGAHTGDHTGHCPSSSHLLRSQASCTFPRILGTFIPYSG